MNKDISFSWDAEKNKANERKHSISFEEARQYSMMRRHCSYRMMNIPLKKTVL